MSDTNRKINLSPEELKIYQDLFDKYKDEPQEQKRVKFEVETNGMKPSDLAKWEDMF